MYRLFVVLCIVVTCNTYAQMLQRTKVLMGTFVSIAVDKEHKSLLQPSFDIIEAVDASLSSYKENSPISTLNRFKKADLDPYSLEAVKLSLGYYKQTDGYFDIAIGKITKDLYRFGVNERVVATKELESSSTSLEAVTLQNNRAQIKGDVKIDLGGMGKGFGVDKVNEFLKQNNVKKAIIALSGDIRCIGECSINVKNPLSEKTPLASFTLCDSGVTTSGTYNRYIKSQKYNHLINPKTKHSQQEFLSITLISTLASATLDAYATAVSVMPKQEAYTFLNSHDLAYIVLQTDQKLVVSENISEYVSDFKQY